MVDLVAPITTLVSAAQSHRTHLSGCLSLVGGSTPCLITLTAAPGSGDPIRRGQDVESETSEERAELLAPKLSIAETSVQRACTLLPGFRARRYRATGQSASNGAPPER
jgi:hypothetical protein